MYRYLLRASRQRHKDSAKIVSGHEIKNDCARVQSSQAFSDFSDFRLFPRTYNSGTRDAQIQIINALRLGQRNRAQQMLVDFSCMNDSSKAEDFDYILDYCARTPDPLFVMEAWKVMVKNEIDMKKKSYRCIIQAFSKGGYFKEAFEWITSLEESDQFHAGLPLYNMVLRECIYRRSMIDVGRCLELMDNQLVGRSEITYWELLKHSVLQKSLSAVHGLWKDCIKHYTPSIIILRKFIWSFTRLHDLESAYQVLQNMVSLVKSSCSTFRKSAAGRYQSSRLDIPIPPACKLSDEGFRLDETLLFQTMFTKSVKEANCFMASDISGIAGCSSNSVADDLLTEGDTADTCFVSDTADAVSSGIHEIKFFGEAEEKGTCSKISSSVAAGIDNQYLVFKKEEMIKHTTDCLQKNNFDYSIPKEAEFIPVVNVLRWSFNDVIQCCAQSGTWELADLLFLQMQALGVEPSPHTYDGLIKAITYGRALADGFELIYSMERRGMKPYNDTIASLSVEHSKILELSKAESLLEMISDNLQKYIHPFNAFLVACDIMDEPERAIRMLVKMKCLNIKPNIRTFELLFSLFGNVNAPYERGNWPSHMHAAERIRHIEMSMRRSGVQHSYTSMKNLIRALGMEGMIPEMLQRLENTEKMLLLEMEPHQITDLYNIVLRALVEAGHGLTAIEYFQRMRSYGFLTDAATYHIMLECCSLIACFRSALALTSLMLRDGLFPQIMTYTALVKVLLAVDDFHGALDIFNRASSDDVQLDVHLFNEILQQAYTRISSEEVEEEYAKGLVEVIEIIIEQMRRDKVKPDPSTCTYAFCSYTELDFHSTAMEALRVLSLRMISENEGDLHEKKTSFADLICSEEPDVESKIVSIFKGGEEYLATGLLNLRWCTFMAGHPLSWSQEESLWAQRLSSSYFTSKRESVNLLS